MVRKELLLALLAGGVCSAVFAGLFLVLDTRTLRQQAGELDQRQAQLLARLNRVRPVILHPARPGNAVDLYRAMEGETRLHPAPRSGRRWRSRGASRLAAQPLYQHSLLDPARYPPGTRSERAARLDMVRQAVRCSGSDWGVAERVGRGETEGPDPGPWLVLLNTIELEAGAAAPAERLELALTAISVGVDLHRTWTVSGATLGTLFLTRGAAWLVYVVAESPEALDRPAELARELLALVDSAPALDRILHAHQLAGEQFLQRLADDHGPVAVSMPVRSRSPIEWMRWRFPAHAVARALPRFQARMEPLREVAALPQPQLAAALRALPPPDRTRGLPRTVFSETEMRQMRLGPHLVRCAALLVAARAHFEQTGAWPGMALQLVDILGRPMPTDPTTGAPIWFALDPVAGRVVALGGGPDGDPLTGEWDPAREPWGWLDESVVGFSLPLE